MTIIACNLGHCDFGGVTAAFFEIIAAWAKVTAVGAFMRQGEVARDRNQGTRVFIGTWQWNRPKQRLCVGVTHFVKHILNRPCFHSLA